MNNTPIILIFTISLGKGHDTAAQGLYDRFTSEGKEVRIINLTEVSWGAKCLYYMFRLVTRYSFLWKYVFSVSHTPNRNGISRKFTRWAFSAALQQVFLQYSSVAEVWLTNPIFSEEIDQFFSGRKYIQVTDYGRPHFFWTWGRANTLFLPDITGKSFLQHYFPEQNIEYQAFPLPQKLLEIIDYSAEDILKIKQTIGGEKFSRIFVFFFHGVLFGNEEEVLLEYKKKISPDGLCIILSGKNYDVFKKFSGDEGIKVYGWRDDVENLYAVADKVIGKSGGAFISEVIALDKEVYIYNALPGQEEENKKFIENVQKYRGDSV